MTHHSKLNGRNGSVILLSTAMHVASLLKELFPRAQFGYRGDNNFDAAGALCGCDSDTVLEAIGASE